MPSRSNGPTEAVPEFGTRQPLPGDPGYDSFWYEWMSRWRQERVEVARRAQAEDSGVQLQLKAQWDACDTCKARNGEVVNPEIAPEPPVNECMSDRACLCTYVIGLDLGV